MENKCMEAYAAWNNDQAERMKSSSGGMFSAFAREIFHEKGIVYGVSETESGLCFQRAVCMEDIVPMRGSKYYQANTSVFDIGTLYRDVETMCPVLLVGTSCQIGMFQAVLREKYGDVPENVWLMDLICHGVGSEKSIKIYRKEMENQYGTLVKHTFRNKADGRYGSQFSEYIHKNGVVYQRENEKDYYMRLFFYGMFLRPSCYKCRYAGAVRCSDISIGDFNGADRVVQVYPDTTHCVSSVLVNSHKGSELLNRIAEKRLISLVPTDYGTIASQNLSLLYPTKRPWGRKFSVRCMNQWGLIHTSRILGGKYYIKMVIKRTGGERFLNVLKKILGRTVIEH